MPKCPANAKLRRWLILQSSGGPVTVLGHDAAETQKPGNGDSRESGRVRTNFPKQEEKFPGPRLKVRPYQCIKLVFVNFLRLRPFPECGAVARNVQSDAVLGGQCRGQVTRDDGLGEAHLCQCQCQCQPVSFILNSEYSIHPLNNCSAHVFFSSVTIYV